MIKSSIYKIEERTDDIYDIANTLGTVVGSTMGPVGKTCILRSVGDFPHVTKDGVTISDFMYSDDDFRETVLKIIKETSSITGKMVGDGTTTSTLLACKLLMELSGSTKLNLKELDADLELLKDFIKGRTVALDSWETTEEMMQILKSIIKISSNGDKDVIELISGVLEDVGTDGVIDVIESIGQDTSVDVKDGIFIEAQAHVMRPVSLETSHVVLVSSPLQKISEYATLLKLHAQQFKIGETPLVIIAKEFSKEIQTNVTANNQEGNSAILLAEYDGFGPGALEILDDMATLLKCKIFSTDSTSRYNLGNITVENLTTVDGVELTSSNTLIKKADLHTEVTEELKLSIMSAITKIKRSGESKIGELNHLNKRLSKYSKTATIYVGGITDADKKETKDRIDDAVQAMYAAIKGGVTPGAGSVLYQASKIKGLSAIMQAVCKMPAEALNNSSLSEDEIFSKKNQVMDHSTEKVGDAFKLGILDPADVLIKALEQSVIIAKHIFGSHAIIVNSVTDG